MKNPMIQWKTKKAGIIKSESEDLITLCLDDGIKKMRVEPPN